MRRKCYVDWLVFVIILIGGLSVGANAEPASDPEPGRAEDLINLYGRTGISDEYAAYVGNEVFVVQVPAGDYLLEYITDMGTYHIVFRASDRALVYVGLNEGDQVNDVVAYPGTIYNTDVETQTSDVSTFYVWPGSTTTWLEVFRQP